MSSTPVGTERYRWLARNSPAIYRPRHVFLENETLSLCRTATRLAEREAWQPDAERTDCRVCVQRLARHPELVEVTG